MNLDKLKAELNEVKRHMDVIVRMVLDEQEGQPHAPVAAATDDIEYTDATPMPFGKYRGTPLGKLPDDYCEWLYEQNDLSDRRLYRWLHGDDESCVDRA